MAVTSFFNGEIEFDLSILGTMALFRPDGTLFCPSGERVLGHEFIHLYLFEIGSWWSLALQMHTI